MNGHSIDLKVFGEITNEAWLEIHEYVLENVVSDEATQANGDLSRIILEDSEADQSGLERKLKEAGVSFILKVSAGNEVDTEYQHNEVVLYNSEDGSSHTFETDGVQPVITLEDAANTEKLEALLEWYKFMKDGQDADLTIVGPAPTL